MVRTGLQIPARPSPHQNCHCSCQGTSSPRPFLHPPPGPGVLQDPNLRAIPSQLLPIPATTALLVRLAAPDALWSPIWQV